MKNLPVSRMLVALFAVAALAGCAHSQMPPTTHSVALTWTAPTSPACNAAAPCTYVLSRISVSGTTCPAVNVTTPNYSPLNSANPVSSLSYTDTAAAGLTVCFVAQTLQGGAVSQPSNAAGPFVVLPTPGAPSTPNGTVADLVQPPLPMPTEGQDAPKTVAKLEGHIR
jgi:hypothetical protein